MPCIQGFIFLFLSFILSSLFHCLEIIFFVIFSMRILFFLLISIWYYLRFLNFIFHSFLLIFYFRKGSWIDLIFLINKSYFWFFRFWYFCLLFNHFLNHLYLSLHSYQSRSFFSLLSCLLNLLHFECLYWI